MGFPLEKGNSCFCAAVTSLPLRPQGGRVCLPSDPPTSPPMVVTQTERTQTGAYPQYLMGAFHPPPTSSTHHGGFASLPRGLPWSHRRQFCQGQVQPRARGVTPPPLTAIIFHGVRSPNSHYLRDDSEAGPCAS